MSRFITILAYVAMGIVLTIADIWWNELEFWAILLIMGVAMCSFADTAVKDEMKTVKSVVRCHECLNRQHCPIRTQCLGDDGYCSLGKSEEE